MSTETLTRSEKSPESVSLEKKWSRAFRLQRAKSFINFKFAQFLGQEYICEGKTTKEGISRNHYLIKERFDKNLRVNLLYVDCGDETPPEFVGIKALIKHYTVYASLHSFSLANGLSVDVFPWWH
ncbi:unnamed protein product [Acanthocheilonema viteae]|uniref:Uncharacterized protein n=1 Tax=Acanthocheilonema viteae TaxID=6277 RepID=A0A498S6G5_ACAVI|nr:unnamed protein product [Acanthocheilonema viteae]